MASLPRTSLALVVILSLVMAACFFALLMQMPLWDWNSARVVLSVGWVHGYPLYSGLDDGPVQTTMYGPVKDLLLLPASLASRPSYAIWIAGAITITSIALPILLLIWCRGRGLESSAGSTERAVFASLFALGGLLVAQSTRDMTGNIHVDAPAVGFALASCVVLMSRSLSGRRLTVAAALAALSVWTKQVQILLPLGQLVYLLWLHGATTAGRYVLRLAAWGFGMLGAFVALFGWDGMWLNIIVLPRDHPKHIDPETLFFGALELAVGCSFGFLVLLLAIRANRTMAWRDRAWLLPALIAVTLLPTSLFARLIAGGRHNSYHAIYFLLATAALILARGDLFPTKPDRARWVVVAAAIGAVLWAPWRLDWRPVLAPLDNPQEQAYEFAKAHPGQAYFPWQPLSTVLAEGRLDHFDFHVHARHAAGHPLSDEHFRAYLPPDLRYVFIRPRARDYSILGYLPEYRHMTTHPDMPGWDLFVKVEPDQVESDPED
ncbi:MAG: hypothetical protein MPN21_18215 [Thermoanaerobaculia bacterium]|nr:hypothetical protein [Thermoanaerobaculia bacterium]